MILDKLLSNSEPLFPNLSMRIIIDIISESDPQKDPAKGPAYSKYSISITYFY